MAVHVATRTERIPRISRFGWLMGLYAENFALLTRLFEPADLAAGTWISSIGDGLDLQLQVVEQHRFTSELRLSYAMLDPVTGEEVDGDDASYPTCSSSVTDNCLQAYERGRSS